jgi:hypothetical protein
MNGYIVGSQISYYGGMDVNYKVKQAVGRLMPTFHIMEE